MKGIFSLLFASIFMFIFSAQNQLYAAGHDKEVREAADQFYKALNVLFTGDVDPMKEVWSHAEDVTYMGPGGGMQVGWTDVLANWEAQAAMKMEGEVKPENIRVFVGKDIAIVQNYEKADNFTVDGKPQPVSIRATNIFRKENGKWKMIGHHTDLLSFLEEE